MAHKQVAEQYVRRVAQLVSRATAMGCMGQLYQYAAAITKHTHTMINVLDNWKCLKYLEVRVKAPAALSAS